VDTQSKSCVHWCLCGSAMCGQGPQPGIQRNSNSMNNIYTATNICKMQLPNIGTYRPPQEHNNFKGNTMHTTKLLNPSFMWFTYPIKKTINHEHTMVICLDNTLLHSLQESESGSTNWYVWHSEDRASWYILIVKANKMHYFLNLFHKVLYMFQRGPLSIIRSISTLYTSNRYLSC
jgi:hypothetical protein